MKISQFYCAAPDARIHYDIFVYILSHNYLIKIDKNTKLFRDKCKRSKKLMCINLMSDFLYEKCAVRDERVG